MPADQTAYFKLARLKCMFIQSVTVLVCLPNEWMQAALMLMSTMRCNVSAPGGNRPAHLTCKRFTWTQVVP